jgi:membrane protein YdbS with pleckstrin-like domain
MHGRTPAHSQIEEGRMRYADTLLIEGEEVALRTRQHWLAFVINARAGFVLWIVAVALLVAANWFVLTKPFTDIVGVVALILFAVGLLIVIIRLWQWWAQDYMVTNRRLMKVWGVFNKRSVDSALEHINDAQLDQSFFGRLLGYGHLDILTASTETTLDDYDMIRDPKGFKKVMLTQKHALETGYRTPTPPLRASAATEAAEPAAVPPPAPAAAPAPAATSSPAAIADRDDTLEVTQTLARLADLRDRGAISAEEYEAKKRELLDRL